MININSSGKDCYILDDYSYDDIVQYEASEYWYLDLYIIVLDDMDGAFSSSKQKYMVLEYPSYTEVNSNNKINDCIWSVPYMAYLFHKHGTKRYKTINAITKFYEEQISSHKELLEELENYRFYHMGILDYNKIKGDHYIEYKVSSRQLDKWKCYYIQEHYITDIDSLGILNLADPEGLHSYKYFPLIPRPIINEDVTYFLGKHLASNVALLLKKSYNKLVQYSNSVSGKILRYEMYGIVFKIDIVGFTEMYNKIVSEMKSLDETGKEIAVQFIAGLSNIFENRMQELGVSQFVIEGDGLTGAIPLENNCANEKIVELLINCFGKIKQDINLLSSKLGETVYLRCSITIGNYFYGKLTGLNSTKQVTGELMILVSRMDQFLQDFVREHSNMLPCKSLLLCIDNLLYNDCKDYFENSDFFELILQAIYRETNINSKVFCKEL